MLCDTKTIFWQNTYIYAIYIYIYIYKIYRESNPGQYIYIYIYILGETFNRANVKLSIGLSENLNGLLHLKFTVLYFLFCTHIFADGF